jgi:choline dehydrogenase-like flavoprotein
VLLIIAASLAIMIVGTQDFDTWAQMGNPGWSYEDVLPFLRRMEAYEDAASVLFIRRYVTRSSARACSPW